MPYGQHITRCLHCGSDYICGDCITSTCSECRIRGHRDSGLMSMCPVCQGTEPERELDEHDKAMLDAARRIRNNGLGF